MLGDGLLSGGQRAALVGDDLLLVGNDVLFFGECSFAFSKSSLFFEKSGFLRGDGGTPVSDDVLLSLQGSILLRDCCLKVWPWQFIIPKKQTNKRFQR